MSTEVHMKRLFLFFVFVLTSLAPTVVHADSLSLWVNRNGDNFLYTGTMNGHDFVLAGGTTPGFFGIGGYAPGSTVGGQTELFLYSTAVWVDGAPVDLMFPFGSATLFMTSFTLPASGQDFSAFVQIGFTASGINWQSPQPIDLGGSAQGWLNFSFYEGRYYASDFVPTTVPEPATLALMGTGMAAIAAAIRRKFRH